MSLGLIPEGVTLPDLGVPDLTDEAETTFESDTFASSLGRQHLATLGLGEIRFDNGSGGGPNEGVYSDNHTPMPELRTKVPIQMFGFETNADGGAPTYNFGQITDLDEFPDGTFNAFIRHVD